MTYDNWKLAHPPEYDNDDAPEDGAEGPCRRCNGERVVITKGDGSEVEHCPDCVETYREDF